MDENNTNNPVAAAPRGPGAPRRKLTKVVTFKLVGNQLVRCGRGKPAKRFHYQKVEMPWDWNGNSIPASQELLDRVNAE